MVALFNKMSITGGSLGLDVPKPVLFGVKMMPMHFFYLTLILIVILCLLIVKMRRSWFGMALASINNDPAAARSFGINVSRYQILTFTIGTAIAGLAGGIYVHRMGHIANTDFAFTVSIQILSMVVIGGIGTIRGPIFGALLISFLPEFLRFADNYRTLIYCVLLAIIVRFARRTFSVTSIFEGQTYVHMPHSTQSTAFSLARRSKSFALAALAIFTGCRPLGQWSTQAPHLRHLIASNSSYLFTSTQLEIDDVHTSSFTIDEPIIGPPAISEILSTPST